MASPASEPNRHRQWRWWIPDYPERLGRRDVFQVIGTVLITVLATVAVIGTWGSGGWVWWLFVVTFALAVVGLVGVGLGLRRSRRRAGP